MTEAAKKYAVVFAGQGAQKPGMGRSLYEASPAARRVFDEAGGEIKYDCFEGGAERLAQTEVTQPAVYTMDMAAYAALREKLGPGFPPPGAVAGFSLGEYAAFTAAGIIGSFETGLALVRTRSLLMKAAGANPDGSGRGAMAAGMGGRDAVLALVEKARGDGILEAVNFNSPQQTVVAGDAEAVARFSGLAKAGRSLGVKAIPLPVSGAFHSPLMRPAAEGLAEALKAYAFAPPSLKVYLNVTGGLFEDCPGAEMPASSTDDVPGEDRSAADAAGNADADAKAKAVMLRQIQSPVQWQATIEAMAAAGIETIVEAGPGKTLSGLVKKTAPEIQTLHVEDAESLEEAAGQLRRFEE
ncbi:MAG: ACP S-malonyltransferase [Clostridiales Family XIII bacterium]|jgi:[acyl-carrier-protein] S-malonyltransferase|nr:ACP S-malonyltransferase [Clostridiales Family XIII bacterium]